ncbi:hypothetical protein [Streptomyces filamentosus]|uniref:hypothetical protein n=1 Tax=Streptomyces filamentosus TaxID=67294 RepID=UPI00123BA379|nr:hypothetical protein [Streptomyces filamentosus]KAA6217534.1 hypothetical protein CP979_11715 [Streptomyces filamentosus]
MPSYRSAPVRSAPSGSPRALSVSVSAKRTIAGLSLWWLASPIAFILSTVVGLNSRDRDPFWEVASAVLLWSGIGGVVVAPAVGLLIAFRLRQRPARRRFAIMGTVSLAVCALALLFWEFAMECAPGQAC